jgi:peptide deformylase
VSIRAVATIGHPILRRPAEPLSAEQLELPATQALIDDMVDTMRYHQGAGLAAPQVMEPVRVTVIEVKANRRYPYKPDIPLTILVNPEIEVLDGKTFANNEGCLSVPGLRGVVHRHVAVGVRALDRHGRVIEREVKGLSAVTFQHEVDHLDGVLFVDRVDDTATFMTWEQFERFHRDAFAADAAKLVARFGS